MSKMSEKKMHYVKRFGAIAVDKGYISIEELIEALAIQVKDETEHGSHRLLGSILFEQDIITADELQDVIDSVLNRNAVAA